jgi:large subunit ribosomal protein L4
MELKVINMKNEPVEKLEVSESLVGAKVKRAVIYELVRQYQAAGRQGTAATKNRALVSGSGRKLWRQKGTGRARIGSIRSPLWRHGGTVFGPQPRSYAYRIPSKKRIAALRAVIAQRMKNNSIYVVDELNFEKPKTKAAKDFLSKLDLNSKTLFVDDSGNKNLRLSVRNLHDVKFATIAGLNIVDALKYKNLVISKKAFDHLTKRLEQ